MKAEASTRQVLLFSAVIVAANIFFFKNYLPAPMNLAGLMEHDLDIVFLQLKEAVYLIVWFLYNQITIIWAIRSYREQLDKEAVEPKSKHTSESLERSLELMCRAMGMSLKNYKKQLEEVKRNE